MKETWEARVEKLIGSIQGQIDGINAEFAKVRQEIHERCEEIEDRISEVMPSIVDGQLVFKQVPDGDCDDWFRVTVIVLKSQKNGDLE